MSPSWQILCLVKTRLSCCLSFFFALSVHPTVKRSAALCLIDCSKTAANDKHAIRQPAHTGQSRWLGAGPVYLAVHLHPPCTCGQGCFDHKHHHPSFSGCIMATDHLIFLARSEPFGHGQTGAQSMRCRTNEPTTTPQPRSDTVHHQARFAFRVTVGGHG